MEHYRVDNNFFEEFIVQFVNKKYGSKVSGLGPSILIF